MSIGDFRIELLTRWESSAYLLYVRMSRDWLALVSTDKINEIHVITIIVAYNYCCQYDITVCVVFYTVVNTI